MNKKTPYIGVTGFTTKSQVEQILKNQNINPSIVGRKLMVGVLVSSKTLKGEQDKWPMRYPKIEDIGSIFLDDPSCLNLVHFSSDNPENLFEDLKKITKLAGPHLHGFQLNMPWPEKEQVERYKELYPQMEFVLQVGDAAFGCMNNDLAQVHKAVVRYENLVDHILLDMSGGEGLPLDSEYIELLVSEFSQITNLGIGAAGGLYAGNVQEKLMDIVNQYSNISFDAEGKLQSETGGLNLNEVRKYLEASVVLFQGLQVA
jgi:hypothetical protein